MKRILNSESAWKIYGVLLAIIVLVVILALALWVRHSAPCWVFPLAEAPTRCLPGSTR